MLKFSLRFLRTGAGEREDDVVNVYTVAASSDLFRVLYIPGDSASGMKYEARMTRGGVLDYVTDMLRSMRYDVDPFDRIQVSTDLHPSVLYAVADMDNAVIRKNLENMVYTSLRTQVVRA